MRGLQGSKAKPATSEGQGSGCGSTEAIIDSTRDVPLGPAAPQNPTLLTASSSVAAGEAIQENAITLKAPHSMSAARLGGDTLALQGREMGTWWRDRLRSSIHSIHSAKPQASQRGNQAGRCCQPCQLCSAGNPSQRACLRS